MTLAPIVTKSESYRKVYEEGGSGWKPEPQQAVQSHCCNQECRASGKFSIGQEFALLAESNGLSD